LIVCLGIGGGGELVVSERPGSLAVTVSNGNFGGVLLAFDLLTLIVFVLLGVSVIDSHFLGSSSSESVDGFLEGVYVVGTSVEIDVEVIVGSA